MGEAFLPASDIHARMKVFNISEGNHLRLLHHHRRLLHRRQRPVTGSFSCLVQPLHPLLRDLIPRHFVVPPLQNVEVIFVGCRQRRIWAEEDVAVSSL